MSFASADFVAQITPLDDRVPQGEQATYEIQITNAAEVADRYTLSSGESGYILFVNERPSEAIDPFEQGTYMVGLSARNFVDPGSYRVPIDIRSRETGIIESVEAVIAIQNPDGLVGQYASSIALSVGAPSEIDPRENLPLSIGLRNRNARSYEQSELTVEITSDIFTDSYQTSLGSINENGEKTTERVIEIDDYQPPGEYPLTVNVVVDERVVSSYESMFVIRGYQERVRQVAQDQFLFKTDTTYSIVNDANQPTTVQIVEDMGVVKQLFTSATRNYEVESIDGSRSLVITQELASQEELVVTVTHNYRLVVLLVLLAIASVIGYYLLRSPVVLEKEAEVVSSVDDDHSEVKTRLFIKNRGSQTLRNIRVVDRISGLAEVADTKALGTLRPTKVVKKKSQGTLIRWDLESLEPFEERIISYTANTPLALVGDISLPGLKVTFEQENGKQRTTHSDEVHITRQ